MEKSAHSIGEKTSGDWRNSGAGFSWSDRNKGRWICKSEKLLGRRKPPAKKMTPAISVQGAKEGETDWHKSGALRLQHEEDGIR
ncbi:hypothetical protein U1Q18_020531 [Sarracenia purpurea var. burkii]